MPTPSPPNSLCSSPCARGAVRIPSSSGPQDGHRPTWSILPEGPRSSPLPLLTTICANRPSKVLDDWHTLEGPHGGHRPRLPILSEGTWSPPHPTSPMAILCVSSPSKLLLGQPHCHSKQLRLLAPCTDALPSFVHFRPSPCMLSLPIAPPADGYAPRLIKQLKYYASAHTFPHRLPACQTPIPHTDLLCP